MRPCEFAGWWPPSGVSTRPVRRKLVNVEATQTLDAAPFHTRAVTIRRPDFVDDRLPVTRLSGRATTALGRQQQVGLRDRERQQEWPSAPADRGASSRGLASGGPLRCGGAIRGCNPLSCIPRGSKRADAWVGGSWASQARARVVRCPLTAAEVPGKIHGGRRTFQSKERR